MVKVAVNRALRDANIPYHKVESAVVGYIYGDACMGTRAMYECGLTGKNSLFLFYMYINKLIKFRSSNF